MKYLRAHSLSLLLIVGAISCSRTDPLVKLIGVWERVESRRDAPMNALVIQENGVVFSRRKDGAWQHFFYTFREEDEKSILRLIGPEKEFRIAVDFTSDGRMQFMPQAENIKGEPITFRRAKDEATLRDELETQILNSPRKPPENAGSGTDSTAPQPSFPPSPSPLL